MPSDRKHRPHPTHAEPLEPRLLLAAAQLLKEINPTSATQFANFLSVNNTTYFTVDDDAHGTELWKTDGTPAGTTLVKDIEPGPASSSPSFLTNVNGSLFFTARTSAYGAELWRSDGTDAGTVMVADISPGPDNGRSGVGGMIALGNTLLFSGATAPNDGVELWAYDVGAASPRLVKDIAGPNYGSGPAAFVRAGNWVYFAATTNPTGRELWRTDGTEANTTLVKDVRPGTFSSNPRPLAALNNQLVFTADNGTIGDELYVTDDTPAGAHLLKEIRPGSSGPGIEYFAVANSRLFFNAYDGTTLGDELYATDGTTAGTTLVKDIYPSGGNGAPTDFVPFGNYLYFQANTSAGRGLFRSDGTANGTLPVNFAGWSQAKPIGVARNTLYIVRGTVGSTGELWAAAGPGGGPVLLQPNLTVTAAPVNVPEAVVFPANDGAGQQLWVSPLAGPAPRPLFRPSPFGPANADARDFTPFGNRYLFSANDGAHGAELWVTDGTSRGTTLLKDVNPGSDYGVNSLVGAAFNGYFYFNGRTTAAGNELWRTDGTPQGTALFKDLTAGTASGNPGNFAVYNGQLYFTTLLNNNQNELWRTDGTTTTRLATLYANVPTGYINALRVIGGNLYIRSEISGQADLYRFNGSAFNNATVNLPYVYDFADAGSGQLYVHAADTTTRLYKLNPATAAATPLTPDSLLGIGGLWGTLGNPTVSYLYFVGYNLTNGYEVWVSDGTPAGTHIVQDLQPGYQTPAPTKPFFYQGHLYFAAQAGDKWSLWYVSGPGAAPAKVLDLAPTTQTAIDVAYADLDGVVAMSTNGADATGTLWRISSASKKVGATGFQHPENGIVSIGFNGADILVFTLKDAVHGAELYRYPAAADQDGPAVTDSGFLPWSTTQTVFFTFDKDLAAAPALSDLEIRNRTTNQYFYPSAVTWNPYTRTLVFTTATPLPPGDYRATLAAGAVTTVDGAPLTASPTRDFTLLRGDANGDRTVNFDDLLVLAKNYNTTDATLATGDFNGDGVVNFDDLLILAKNYNATLPPTPAAPLSASLTATTTAARSATPTPFATKPLAPKPKPIAPPPPPKRPTPLSKLSLRR